MKQTFTIKQKAVQFIHILLPILITQIGLFSMNFFNTTMSGNASPQDLAGVAIGSSIWVPVFTGLSGILLSITTLVAQLAGANQTKDVQYTVVQGIYLAIIIAIGVIICGFFSIDFILGFMSLENAVYKVAKNYLTALSFGIIPLFVYTVLRCFIDALGKTKVTMLITLLSLPINVILNYFFIFGKLGFPKLGGVGAGVASSITYWCITFITIYIVKNKQPFSDFRVFSKVIPVSTAKWTEILKIGIPIGFAIFFETSIFATVTLLMSSFPTVTIASHQAALNFASFLYMIPLSISMALTIVVGFESGAKRFEDAKQYCKLGITIAVMMALICAGGIYFLKEQIAGLYTSDEKVLLSTQKFLMYAIFFQLSDALATPIQGALRGYKDVYAAFIMAFISFWVIGLPLGYFLANFSSLGAFGYWIGLIAGLTAGAIGFSSRLFIIQKRQQHEAKSM
jgi:MATE family multidrug resistance protein